MVLAPFTCLKNSLHNRIMARLSRNPILKLLLVPLTVGVIFLLCLLIAANKEFTLEKKITTKKLITEKNTTLDNKHQRVKEILHNSIPLNSCEVDPVISFRPQGRLGNQICEYIHLYHARKMYSIEGRVHPAMWMALRRTFPSLTLEPLSERCFVELSGREVEYKAVWEDANVGDVFSAMLTGTPCQPYKWWHLRNQWRDELRFSVDLQISAATRKSKPTKQWLSNQLRNGSFPGHKPTAVVGVHVRRGDFIALLEKFHNEPVPTSYYHRAFQYFRSRWEHPVFLVLTEPAQRDWCRKHLGIGADDVIVVDDGASATMDLALLASMEHIIYSYGTFGLMAILLSDVQTVAYPGDHHDITKKRYSHHRNLDRISQNLTNVNFVKIPFH